MIDLFARAVVRAKWFILLAFAALTALSAHRMLDARLDTDISHMLPADHPARVSQDRLNKLFGGADMVMIIVTADDVLARDTLKQIKQISRKVAWVKNVKRVLSMFTLKEIRVDEGQMMAAPAVKRLPRNAKKREALRERIKKNEFVYGTVVSTDFKAALLIGMLRPGANDRKVLAEIQQVIDKNPGPGVVQLAGMPLVRTSVARDLSRDIKTFATVGLALVLLVLFLFFRHPRVVLPPFFLMLAACVAAMGVLPLLGWKVQVITLIVPLFVLAVCNAFGVHMLANHQDELRGGTDALDSGHMARGLIKRMGPPLLWTGITVIAALLCLRLHQFTPARQLGVLAAVGVLFAMAGGVLFIPALVAVLPGRRAQGGPAAKPPLMSRLLHGPAQAAVSHPGRVAAAAVIVMLLAAPGVYFMETETNPIRYYDEETSVARTSRIIAEKFGGFAPISILGEGDIKAPKVLLRVDALERHLQKDPLVGQTLSLARVVRKLNSLTHGGDKAFDRIPATRAALSELMMVYSMSGNPEDFDRLVDFPYKHAQLTARITSLNSADMGKVVQKTRDYLKTRGGGVLTQVGGVGALFADLSNVIQSGLAKSLIASLVLVFVLAMVLTRDLRIGVLVLGAILVVLVLLHGLMGYLGLSLNIATVLLVIFVVSMGLDNAFNMISRCRLELAKEPDLKQAMAAAIKTCGRGILGNALAVSCGFTVTFFSDFTIIRSFGLLVILCLVSSAVIALIVLPALCLLLRPRYLQGNS
jgi:uncharacterized protein